MKVILHLLVGSLLLSMFHLPLSAQIYDDYLGNGHNVGIKISSSSDQQSGQDENVANGTQFLVDSVQAARFLTQSSLGYDMDDITQLAQVGLRQWLDDQMTTPDPLTFLAAYDTVYKHARDILIATHGAAAVTIDAKVVYLEHAFHDKILTESYHLRHKVAFALSQLFVVSKIGANNNGGRALASYYDILYQNAFGNYRDLLQQITYSPAMGVYLSYFQNRKADPTTGALPDENFAREIMQLFTIGLWQLQNNGKRQTDASGMHIPTYDITDIQELAKVFTGLSGSVYDTIRDPSLAGQPLIFTRGVNKYDLSHPMQMFDTYHETGAKTLPDGTLIPANQTGDQDINMALDWLFNHPNVGPFLAFRLIQQMVKSNPSNDYINRVATAFNDNGQGVRGDMKAVITAVLLDPEARDCDVLNDIRAGRLLQPVEKMLHVLKALKVSTPSGRFWHKDSRFFDEVEQAFLNAPSVFNFFSPFYSEPTIVQTYSMVSPEFEILHSTSGIQYINLMENMLKYAQPFLNFTASHATGTYLANNPNDAPVLDFSDLVNVYDTQGLNSLIERVNLLFARGQLEQNTKDIIANTIPQFEANNSNYDSYNVVKDVIFFTMLSPNYNILK